MIEQFFWIDTYGVRRTDIHLSTQNKFCAKKFEFWTNAFRFHGILYNENSKDIVSACYKVSDIEEGKYLDGVVSRKKQMLPMLLEYLER